MLIQLLVDNKKSWIIPYAKRLREKITEKGITCNLLYKHEDIVKGDILVLLSCEKILKDLNLNKHNIVVHESALPAGRGWSPLTWQILGGKNEIPITLFEADKNVDSGVIYYKDVLQFDDHELIDELKIIQGTKTMELVIRFINDYPNVKGVKQQGAPTYYSKRVPEDSQININKTVDSQFNLLRVCDNERYPAYFIKNGKKYIIKIEKEHE